MYQRYRNLDDSRLYMAPKKMRFYRLKNRSFVLLSIFSCMVVLILLKRQGVQKFYEETLSTHIWTTSSSSDDKYSDASYLLSSFILDGDPRASVDSWPPKLRIVKKSFGSATVPPSMSNRSIDHRGESISSSMSPETLLSSNFSIDSSGRKSIDLDGHRQESAACRFPELRVDDPAIRHLFHDVPKLECAKEKNWVYVRNGTFYIDPDVARRHSIDGDVDGPTEISCDVMSFWRESDQRTGRMTQKDYPNGTKLKGDFFKASCQSSSDGATYSNVHATIVPLRATIDRCRSKRAPRGSSGLNVYMLGFDSISRMTFMRKMPKTYKYLKETMGAYVMEGYNIVGDGTPQALIPILTGKTEVELPMTRKRFRNANYVNVYPFVWNEYRDAGYATLYGEDAASIGTFTYRLRGFDAQPTDHYMRTFYTVAEYEARNHKKYCWGSEPHHKVHFGYVEQFFANYPRDIRKFAFQFHSILSHENINEISIADEDMVEHLKYFVDNGYANESVIIFMSDHGHRFASLRETQQGKLEERLPFFSFVFPEWFRRKYPRVARAMEANTRRLTTPFDIHATLQTILDFRDGQVRNAARDDSTSAKDSNLPPRQLSLLDYVPASRTCADARIEPHWCSCLDWTQVPVDDQLVDYMARGLVATINAETERERASCSLLKLAEIVSAAKYAPSTAVLRYKEARDKDGFVPDLTANTPLHVEYYQLNVRTQPGGAKYEASITYDRRANEVSIDLDVVSHVNPYGDLPHCVIDRDYFLAKWCVCYDKIDRKTKEGHR